MSDLDHYATKRDVAAISGLGAPVYTVGPAGSSATFNTVQEGVDAATVDVLAGTVTDAVVLVAPGTYLQDVIVRNNHVHVVGQGAIGEAIVRSLTFSNATLASITAFNASGLKHDLVVDPLVTTPPDSNEVQNITLYRDAAAAPWAGAAAKASLRFLGAEVALTTFGLGGFLVNECAVRKANGAAAGTGGLYACYTNAVGIGDTQMIGGAVFDQCAAAAGSNVRSGSSVKYSWTYDSAAVIPVSAHTGLEFDNCDTEGTIACAGDVGLLIGRGSDFGVITDASTAAGSASTFRGCECHGAITIAAGAATISWEGGEFSTGIGGAGAANFTQVTRLVAGHTYPTTDNADDIGSITQAFKAIHARTVTAHADATNAVYSALTATGVISKGTNLSVAPGTAADDAAAFDDTVAGGEAGKAVGAVGKVGGIGQVVGGVGGAGAGALAAGKGGAAQVIGGAAGANGGGGGNDGGDVLLQGGAATGAGTAGKVTVASDLAPTADNTDKAGSTDKAFSEVHARSLVAHGDATDTIKTTITAAAIAPTVAHGIQPTTAAADTVGKAETIVAGNGGAGSAATGGAGAILALQGGKGGAGNAVGPRDAGAGGAVNISGGDAGAVGGAGAGAAGGDVTLAGGAKSGALRPGIVSSRSALQLYAIAKAGRAALTLAAPEAGCCIFCTDAGPAGVGIPLWWDGAAWRDAAGNVIA